MAIFATTFLLILAIFNVIATISLWENWLDAMDTSWAFRVFFKDEVKSEIWPEVASTVVGNLAPAGIAFLASARQWPRVHVVHLLCGVWLLAYLFLRVPSMMTMFKQPFFDMSFGVGMWYRFHGFPAGSLTLTILLLFTAALGYFQQRPTERNP